jgi:fibronectin type 3 domain-containing protein
MQSSHDRANVVSAPRRGRRLGILLAVLTSAGLVISVPTTTTAVSDPCGTDSNPIACENSQLGTPASVWSVVGTGDPSIEGFATNMSVNHGSTVGFKINTPATSYRIDIYRMGYYQGNGARLVDSISPSAQLPQSQPSCLFDTATRLVDCGNWSESASWDVPATAVSGVYFADLVRTDQKNKSGTSQLFFVVRADESHASILYQTSDTTWQAYNRYGGYSLYYGSPARAYKVSYNRPFITRGCCDESFVFSAEYPMIRWMEANGYDMSYSSGIDTDRSGAALLNHRTFMSSGHDEYWSAGQRASVEAARDAGVNLAFFSGNEVFWKTRWEPSIDGSNTSYRTLVTYKETNSNAKIDPTSIWTGTWRDKRFSPPADGGRPENALTGTLFTVNCCTSTAEQDFSITVPEPLGKTRLWRNTAAATLPPGAVATLSPATLGIEWDEDVDNGARPQGLIHFSSTTEAVTSHLSDDWGNTFSPGNATHHLTLYRAPSGAYVFGAGTIRWSWGLDNHHDSDTSVVDPIIQQATVNLLADLGAQPASLQPGLVLASASTDTTPPVATLASPADLTSALANQPTTVIGTATDTGGVVAGIEVTTDNGATWHPAEGTHDWSYTWVPTTPGAALVAARAIDDSGNIGPTTPARRVTVLRTCPCSVWLPSVGPKVQAVTDTSANELGMKFVATVNGSISGIRFFKGPNNTGTHTGHLWSRTGVLLGSVTFTGETSTGWQQANFATPVPVTAGSTYVVSYFAPVGRYASDPSYFASSGVDSSPLKALANGTDGYNGVYKAGTSGFPIYTYKSTNYWVDVVFNTPPPASPQTTTATAKSATEVDVSWSDVATETAYRVEVSSDGSSGWTPVATVGQNVTTFQDFDLIPSTLYYYRVIAINSGGSSAASPTASATTPPQAPATPSGLSATAVSSTEIQVSWTGVPSETGYVLERSSGQSGWTTAQTTTETSVVDGGLTPRTTYSYRVRAVNSGASSAPSAAVDATTLAATNPPATPTGLSATSTSTQVQLTWNDVPDEEAYEVQRYAGDWITLDTLAANTVTYVDAQDLLPSTTYAYRVIATNGGGSSLPSDVVYVTTLEDPPAAPGNLVVTDTTTSSVSLAWTAGADATSFDIQRSTDGTSWTLAGSSASTAFTDSGLASDTTYMYRVVANNSGGSSPPSAVLTVRTVKFIPPLVPPGNVAVSSTTSTTATLSWTADSPASSFRIERADQGSTNWTTVGTTAQLTFTDVGLAPGTTYQYRIFASDGTSESAASAVVTATTLPGAPSAPTNVVAAAASSTDISVRWSAAAGADSYVVEQSSDGVTWQAGVQVTAPTTSTTFGSLPPSTVMSYRVTARNAGGASAPSVVAAAKTYPRPCPCTIFTPTSRPVAASSSDTTANELGVKFRADVGGTITGVRFYKGTLNTGTHIGHLWTKAGALLATATFAGESASGWQEVLFSTPVTITAGTTYVASYTAPNGRYASDTNFFATSPAGSSPLTGLQNGVDGTNGVYFQGTSGFPKFSYKSSNYWVDVIFSAAAPATPTSLRVSAVTANSVTLAWNPSANAAGYRIESSVDGATGWTLRGSTTPDTATFVDPGLAASTTLYYRVLAVNSAGSSAPSTVITATTSAS